MVCEARAPQMTTTPSPFYRAFMAMHIHLARVFHFNVGGMSKIGIAVCARLCCHGATSDHRTPQNRLNDEKLYLLTRRNSSWESILNVLRRRTVWIIVAPRPVPMPMAWARVPGVRTAECAEQGLVMAQCGILLYVLQATEFKKFVREHKCSGPRVCAGAVQVYEWWTARVRIQIGFCATVYLFIYKWHTNCKTSLRRIRREFRAREYHDGFVCNFFYFRSLFCSPNREKKSRETENIRSSEIAEHGNKRWRRRRVDGVDVRCVEQIQTWKLCYVKWNYALIARHRQ